MRQVIGLLRDSDDVPGPPPGPEPLRTLVERFRALGPAVDVRLPDQAAWPPEISTTVYRIVQESLTNIVQHAPAVNQVRITVEESLGELRLEITDDGPAGLSWRPRTGYGLVRHARASGGAGRPVRRRAAPGRWLVRARPDPPDAGVGVSIRVLIADDQPLIRSGLRLILEDQPVPGQDGIAVTAALAGPEVAVPLRVVIVTTFDLDDYVYGALRSGAVGFVLKGSAPALLVEAFRAARAGDALVSPQITLRLLRRLAPVGPLPVQPAVPLSERERRIAEIIAKGRTNQEIAAELFISLSTVKTHLASIQHKLGVRNRVGIAAWAWESRF